MSVLSTFTGPLPAFNFTIVLIDTSSTLGVLAGVAGPLLGGFSECTGLDSSIQAEEYREGGVNDRIHRFPGPAASSNITLKHGVGLGDDLWNWHNGFLTGKGKRRDGLITLQNELGVPVKVWKFDRGLPVKWLGPTFNARQSEVAIEAIEIAHEKVALYSPGVGLAAAVDAIASAF